MSHRMSNVPTSSEGVSPMPSVPLVTPQAPDQGFYLLDAEEVRGSNPLPPTTKAKVRDPARFHHREVV